MLDPTALIATVLVVYAKTDLAAEAQGHDRLILRYRPTPAFSVRAKARQAGMRGSHTGELVFKTLVPREHSAAAWAKGTKVLA